MACLLCLELNINIESAIRIYSSTWNELNVEKIIEKHLWPMAMYKTESHWLCSTCWQILKDFHRLYALIENAHINLNGILKSETDASKHKEFLSENLLEPEILLEQEVVSFVKKEYKDPETDNDISEDFKDEDDIPLINMCPSIDSSFADPMNESEHSIEEDPLVKRERIKKIKKRRPKSDLSKSVKTYKKIDSGNDTDFNVKSDPEASQMPNETSANSLLLTAIDRDEPLRYYYQSKINISEYDSFINQHFKLICSKCQSSVNTFEELQQHFVEKHQKKQAYVVCCDTKFRDRGFLVDHINIHLNPEYFKCEYCSEVLTLRKSFKNHMKAHDKVYGCDMCEKKFVSKYLVNKHKLTHLSEDEKKFVCDTCEKSFACESMLTSHQRIVHLKKYSKLCEICGQSIPNSETFKRHMEKHEGITEPTLSCEICGRLVGSKHSLRVHMKSIHPEDGKHEYVCHLCHKVSPNKRALREHIRRVHASGYNHKCTVCEKAFKRMDHLKDHMATHTGVGTSKCPWCPKVFNANSSMHLHRKKVHPKEWEEVRRKRYSGKMPPNSKPQHAIDIDNVPLQFN